MRKTKKESIKMSKKMNLNEYANILFEKKRIKHEIKRIQKKGS